MTMSARSAKQAAMVKAGLASGTQIYSSRARPANQRVPTRSSPRQAPPQDSGSQARLGDILVSILERLTALEARVASLHQDHVFQAIENIERRFTCLERNNDDCLAHILNEIAGLRAACRVAQYPPREVYHPRPGRVSTPPSRVTSPLDIRPRSSQSCLADWSGVEVGADREIPPLSPSSVGTNGLGYDGDVQSDMASPTPSEAKEITQVQQESGTDGENLGPVEEVLEAPAVVEQSDDGKTGEPVAGREVTIEISDAVSV